MASSKKSANLSRISRDEVLEKLKLEKLIEAKGNELFLTKQGEVILNEEASHESGSGIKNPFLEGKREWDLRYGSTINQNHRLWLSNFVSWIITVLALLGMYSIAHQNHVEPIFFAVDKIGRIIATGNPTSKIKVNQDMMQQQLSNYIIALRSFSSDPAVNNHSASYPKSRTKKYRGNIAQYDNICPRGDQE